MIERFRVITLGTLAAAMVAAAGAGAGPGPVIRIESPADACAMTGEGAASFSVVRRNDERIGVEVVFRGPNGTRRAPAEDRTVAALPDIDAGRHDVSFSLRDLPPGPYACFVRARDASGNQRDTSPVHVRVGPGPHVPRVMIDDDFTRIMNIPNACNTYISPQTNGHMNIDKLTAAVTHIATNRGLDTYVFCPGLGEVLPYRSDYYPVEKHERFWEMATSPGNRLRTNVPLLHYARQPPDGMGRDPIDDVRDVVARINPEIKFFVSVRMNDGHLFLRDTASLFDHETMEIKAPRNLNIYGQLSLFRWLHPEARIGEFSNLKACGSSVRHLFDYGWNWTDDGTDEHGMRRSVVHHKLAIVLDVMKNHRMDGILLDFMRLPYLFNPDKVPPELRVEIMSRFVAAVREYADGEYRERFGGSPQIAVRIPFAETEWGRLGIDLRRWAVAGVDIFVLSSQRQWVPPVFLKDGTLTHDIRRFKEMAGGGVSFIAELTYNSEYRSVEWNGKTYAASRRTTDEQLVSGAYAFGRRGADGIYLFNFPYYESVYKDPEVGVPPYRMVEAMALRREGRENRSDVHYTLRAPHVLDFPDATDKRRMQLPVEIGGSWTAVKFFAPKPGAWPERLRLRVEAAEDVSEGQIEARVNGHRVEGIVDTSEPFAPPFRFALCDPRRTAAFVVPASVMDGVDGELDINLRSAAGAKTVRWIDLTSY